MKDPLVPIIYQVKAQIPETHDIFTLVLARQDAQTIHPFFPGQFNMLYLFGVGECAISLSGPPDRPQELMHTVRAVGHVTTCMQKLKEGDEIGVRGPFGSHWPLNKTQCDVLIVAGGVGLAPLRSLLLDLIDKRDHYQNITLLYGGRTPDDILYQSEMEKWEKKGIEVKVTVDTAEVTWSGRVGVVTKLIEPHMHAPDNTLVFLCGPEIMLKFAIHELLRVNTDTRHIYMAMERNMQCAVGFCGHCQYGPYFMCKDGPIFSYEQIKHWLPIKEL